MRVYVTSRPFRWIRRSSPAFSPFSFRVLVKAFFMLTLFVMFEWRDQAASPMRIISASIRASTLVLRSPGSMPAGSIGSPMLTVIVPGSFRKEFCPRIRLHYVQLPPAPRCGLQATHRHAVFALFPRGNACPLRENYYPESLLKPVFSLFDDLFQCSFTGAAIDGNRAGQGETPAKNGTATVLS